MIFELKNRKKFYDTILLNVVQINLSKPISPRRYCSTCEPNRCTSKRLSIRREPINFTSFNLFPLFKFSCSSFFRNLSLHICIFSSFKFFMFLLSNFLHFLFNSFFMKYFCAFFNHFLLFTSNSL